MAAEGIDEVVLVEDDYVLVNQTSTTEQSLERNGDTTSNSTSATAAEDGPSKAEGARAPDDPKKEAASAVNPAVIMSGYLMRQGSINPSWRKSYFVLKDKKLLYVPTENDDLAKPDGEADLTKGRGVRSRKDCAESVEWPEKVKEELCFGVAVESGTYYLFGRDTDKVNKWKDELDKVIKEFGKSTDNKDDDVVGMPETLPIKIARGVAKVATKVLPFIAKSGLVDEDVAEMMTDAGEAIEKQENMDRNTSITDRVKGGASSAVSAGGKLSHNEYVGVAADVVTEQLDDDKNTSLQDRLAQAAGTGCKGMAKTDLVANNEAAKETLQVGGVAADVVKEQVEADKDTTIEERIMKATGTACKGLAGTDLVKNDEAAKAVLQTGKVASDVVVEQMKEGEDASIEQRVLKAVGTAGKGMSTIGPIADNEVAKAVLEVGGEAVHKQGEADKDTTIGERVANAAATIAGGAAKHVDDETTKDALKVAETAAKETEKVIKEERKKDKKESDDDKNKENKDKNENNNESK